MNNNTLYAIKDLKTGKLVSGLSARNKKYYSSRKCVDNAIRDRGRKYLAVVTFKLVPVSEERVR